ncbi:MAG TPA: toxin-antitoxin system protein [Chloroflexi bacterium]|nr:toxin-antitoxin system protein [Chloroflexota bacterium]
MSTTTIRVSQQTHAVLREMADQSGTSILQVLEKAVAAYSRQQQLEALNAAYAALREAPDAWEQLKEERAAWDTTLLDGLEE